MTETLAVLVIALLALNAYALYRWHRAIKALRATVRLLTRTQQALMEAHETIYRESKPILSPYQIEEK